MTTYVALLRGINVGGKTLRMGDLRTVCERLGYQGVQTYIQSGNVVFGAERADAGQLSAAIREATGVQAGVLLRTSAEMAGVARAHPFSGEPRQLHVTFLDGEPAGRLPPSGFEPDEYRVAGREVYLHCPNGYGQTKLDNGYLERRLRVMATTRNWATVRKLAEMAGV
jgi:uncharacterized protein (DUF1697 family)